MPTAARIDWAKDARFPTSDGTCGDCGTSGQVKLAWDRQRAICIQSTHCLSRMATKHSIRHPKEIQPVKIEEMRALTVAEDVEDALAGRRVPVTKPKPERTIRTFGEVTPQLQAKPKRETAEPFVATLGLKTKMMSLTCSKCAVVWERPSQRGRPPKFCSTCKPAS